MSPPKPALVAALVEWFRKVRRVHQDQRLLRTMSERELTDLGVGRSEIPGLLRQGAAAGRALFIDAAAPRSGPRNRARCAAAAGPVARP
jgi:uncharacterized protein YjiS (DUF1127 family)